MLGGPIHLLLQLRQAEIQNLRFAPAGDKDVSRLDVAMDYALEMSSLQPVGNLNGNIEQFVNW